MVVLMFVEHVFSAYLPVLFFKVEKAPVVCKDVSLCGRPRGYALDQHDKTRIVILCTSARTFFYNEKCTWWYVKMFLCAATHGAMRLMPMTKHE
jgi:hypothetical protein